ncbi:YtrH family sporulation protein, partial [Bacillus pumilus]|uniref:YtrH family sporulation protein n=1 Tax=Bacillus pumilus TaxID=1408 RepID=UPI0011A46105
GVILGGAIMGGVGGYLSGEGGLWIIRSVGNGLKIWGVVGGMGGRFDGVYRFERGIFEGKRGDILKEIVLIVCGMGGG